MPLNFKPMPWLTVFTILGLVLLLKLGFWQKDRLAWKTGVLQSVEAAAEAPPFGSLAEIISAFDAGEPVDFRRYQIVSEASDSEAQGEGYFVYDPSQGNISWRLYRPETQGALTVYQAGLSVRDNQRDKAINAQGSAAETYRAGYVRVADEQASGFVKWAKSKPDPEGNNWFAFDQDNLWERDGIDMRLWLDLRKTSSDPTAELPPLRPDIPNNHRDYMLTWFSLAALLLIYYVMLHMRAGRLGRKDA